MPLLARVAAAAVAGIGVGISFEPIGLVYLLPVAIAAFTLLSRGLSLFRGFLVGTVFGTSFMLVLLPWLQVIGADAWVMLSVFQGAFYGLLGIGCVAVRRLPGWPLWAAALWVGVDALRSTVPFGGFPWGRLGFAAIDTPVAPLFAYVGSAGAAFAIALVGTVLAWATLHVRHRPAPALGAVVLAGLLASVGTFLPVAGPSAGDADGATVAAVQGDVPGEGMNAFAERRAVLDNHVEATKEFARSVAAGEAPQPDLVIWPENSTDIDPYSDPTVYEDIQDAVTAVGVPTLVGALTMGPAGQGIRNVGIVWDPESGPGETYAKSHLVPFGEYIPFREALTPYFSRLEMVGSDKIPGTEPGLLEMAGVTVGDLICFEVAYDGLVRALVEGAADVVVVQTNNATYMGTGQIEQQFAISRLRAIETNRYVVVAATNGVSGVIAPDGEVVTRAPVRSQEVVVEQVGFPGGVTPGVRFGGWIELVLALAGAAAAVFGVVVGRRRGAAER